MKKIAILSLAIGFLLVTATVPTYARDGSTVPKIEKAVKVYEKNVENFELFALVNTNLFQVAIVEESTSFVGNAESISGLKAASPNVGVLKPAYVPRTWRIRQGFDHYFTDRQIRPPDYAFTKRLTDYLFNKRLKLRQLIFYNCGGYHVQKE